MAVSYKKLLMRKANISASIITKLKNGQYIALDKVESICVAMGCTPNDILKYGIYIPKDIGE